MPITIAATEFWFGELVTSRNSASEAVACKPMNPEDRCDMVAAAKDMEAIKRRSPNVRRAQRCEDRLKRKPEWGSLPPVKYVGQGNFLKILWTYIYTIYMLTALMILG